MSTGQDAVRAAMLVGSLALIPSCGRDAASRDSSAAHSPAAVRAETALATKHAPLDMAACVAPMRSAWEAAPVGAATFVVNRGTQGMSSRTRWLLSPDSAAIVVIDDPVGVENEPVADAVFYATERTGRTWRMDSVWSAAPSPDWRYLAIGRAVVIGGGEQQRVPSSAWSAAAQRLREVVHDPSRPPLALTGDSLRAHSYPVSGMGVVEGAGVTLVLELDALPSATPRFIALDGWRVDWSCDARSIFIGERPVHAENGAPASTTRSAAIAVGGAPTSVRRSELHWSEGPIVTIGVATRSPARSLRVRGRSIESRSGRVVVRDVDGAGRAVEHDVGPGVPLAATRGGHFILALAPRAGARPQESSDNAVVYRVP
ncbi:MAG: hypothetical protein ABI601_14170 [bacterium]